MRTSLVKVGNREHMLCMSNRVLVDMEARGQNLQEFLSDSGKTITNVCWLLRRMSEAGRAYAALAGLGDYPAISEEEILDASDSGDFEQYMSAIMEAASGERKVDAEPPKNAASGLEEGREN